MMLPVPCGATKTGQDRSDFLGLQRLVQLLH